MGKSSILSVLGFELEAEYSVMFSKKIAMTFALKIPRI